MIMNNRRFKDIPRTSQLTIANCIAAISFHFIWYLDQSSFKMW